MIAEWFKNCQICTVFFINKYICQIVEHTLRAYQEQNKYLIFIFFRNIYLFQTWVLDGTFRTVLIVKAGLFHGNMCVEYTLNLILVLTCFFILWASVILVFWLRLLIYYQNHQTLIYICRTSFRIFSPFPIIWNNRLCANEGATFITYTGENCTLLIIWIWATRNCQEMCQIH
jgi:hypothetical protein